MAVAVSQKHAGPSPPDQTQKIQEELLIQFQKLQEERQKKQ